MRNWMVTGTHGHGVSNHFIAISCEIKVEWKKPEHSINIPKSESYHSCCGKSKSTLYYTDIAINKYIGTCTITLVHGTILSKRNSLVEIHLWRTELMTKLKCQWDWHDCSNVILVHIFPCDTGTVVTKWHWDNCSQVTLAKLFPNDTDTILLKWYWYNYSQVCLDFLICILFCSLFI